MSDSLAARAILNLPGWGKSPWQKGLEAALAKDREFVAEWEKTYGEPYPRTPDDWIRWATRLGLKIEDLQNLEWSPGSENLPPQIEGHLLRLRDRKALGEGPDPLENVSDRAAGAFHALKQLCELDNEHRWFQRKEWASAASISESTVTRVAKELKDEGLVEYKKGSGYRITDASRNDATVTRR